MPGCHGDMGPFGRLSASLASQGKQQLKQASALLQQARTPAHPHVKKPPTLAGKLGRLFSACLLIGLVYAACYLSIGEPFYYGGPAWSTMLIWAAAQGAGWLFGMVRLPALLGMLMIGLVLRNAAPSSVEGLPTSWSVVLRTAALGTIFLRSGLELDLKVFKRVGGAAVRLLLIPGLTEAVVDGMLSMPLLGLPVMWGLTLGFILKAVGPAVIITTMYEVQKANLGTAKGIPSIIVAAASFDDMVAITGYSLCSNFAFANGGENLGWQIAHGPVEIAVGTVAGLLGGLFCSLTVMWRTRFQRSIVAWMTAMTMIFMFYHFNMRSAGPLAALVTGMVLRVCCDNGWPRLLSMGPNKEYTHQIELDLGVLWRWAAQPVLFGIIGTLVNLRTMQNPGVLPRSLALIILGLIVRTPLSFMAVAGAGLTKWERLFVAIAWTPKATVQAALGPLPLDTVRSHANPDPDAILYAETILTTSVLAILVCSIVGVIGVHVAAPRLLAKGNEPSHGTPERVEWEKRQAEEREQAAAEAGAGGHDMSDHPAVLAHVMHRISREQYSMQRVSRDQYNMQRMSREASHRGSHRGSLTEVPAPIHPVDGVMLGDSESEDEEYSDPNRTRSSPGSPGLESFSSWRAAVSSALSTAGSHLHHLLHHTPRPTDQSGTSSNPLQHGVGMIACPSAPALMQTLGGDFAWRAHDVRETVEEEEPSTPQLCRGIMLASKKVAEESDSDGVSPRSSATPRGTPMRPVEPLSVGRQPRGAPRQATRGHITWAAQLAMRLGDSAPRLGNTDPGIVAVPSTAAATTAVPPQQQHAASVADEGAVLNPARDSTGSSDVVASDSGATSQSSTSTVNGPQGEVINAPTGVQGPAMDNSGDVTAQK